MRLLQQSVTAEELRQVPAFSGCSPAELETLRRAIERIDYAAGEVLFEQGERPDGMFAVASGRVELFQTSDQGKEVVLCSLGSRRCCAGCPLIDGGPAAVGARASESTTVYFLPTATADELIRSGSPFAMALLQLLSRRLSMLSRTAGGFALMCVQQRLCHLLLAGIRGDAPQVVSMSQEELAARLATAPEVVRRALRRLRAAGAVRTGRRFLVVNPPALRRLVLDR